MVRKKLIRRKLLKDIELHIDKKEISLIVGPRQAGKTTIMMLLEEKLKKNNQKTLFFNLDRESDKQYFDSQETLLRKIQLEIGENGYVFIDEMQRKENAGLFLKGIYDSNFSYKFIVSGSGSLELKEKIHESLAGRKKMFALNTVSFEEFVDFRTNYKYSSRLSDFFEIEKEKTQLFLEEYLNFGGYPRVILAKELKEKRDMIDEIFHSCLEKDISYLLKVKRVDAFSELIKLLSNQIGQLVNYSKICSELNISIQTIKNYLYFGEKIFIIQKLTPYFKNTKKEIVKSPVFYFYDNGLRNYGIGRFGSLFDFGSVFENFIFNILKEKIRGTEGVLNFWRTKEKAEVDFVIDYGNGVLPIEVKYKKFNRPQISRSLRSFISKYNPKKALIINRNFRKTVVIDQTEVLFLPFTELAHCNLSNYR